MTYLFLFFCTEWELQNSCVARQMVVLLFPEFFNKLENQSFKKEPKVAKHFEHFYKKTALKIDRIVRQIIS